MKIGIHDSETMCNGLVVDLFAGGGGASTGLAQALGRDPDIAINHDAEALSMHIANHPHTRHMLNDITRVLPLDATGGRPIAILHASPDCTHFSKAKGGKPRSQHIRDLAWVVIRWAEDTRPMLITLENVEEFQTWGPLDDEGHPIKEQAGQTFRSWGRRLRRLGYRVEWRELLACDYGAPTKRKRLFVVARRDGGRIIWPKPTHGDPRSQEVQTGQLMPWRTAAECIDWSIPGRSIFDRKKTLADKTQRRIAEGIRKYIINAEHPFIISTDAILSPVLSRQFGCSIGQSVTEPHPTITQSNHDALITANLIKLSGTNIGTTEDNLMREISPHALVASCLIKYYGNEKGGVSVSMPLHTITSKDRMGLVCMSLNTETRHYAHVKRFLMNWNVIGKSAEAEFSVRGTMYRITDIMMRMLTPRELYRAQGFPDTYVIAPECGGKPISKTAQVRMCGNSVPPVMVAALVHANGPATWESPVRPSFPLFTACCSGAWGALQPQSAPQESDHARGMHFTGGGVAQ